MTKENDRCNAYQSTSDSTFHMYTTTIVHMHIFS